ncbi:MAG: hypothetical protein KDC26_06790 [Armatimonadetes bacterium]|nr:hypothetical protein [Armatimonadota bacterium]
MKKSLAILILLMSSISFAQADGTEIITSAIKVDEQKISISSKGLDIRDVLYDLFKKTEHNFVIDSGVRFVLYLNLDGLSFDEALHIILKHGNLGYEVKNDIYYVGTNRSKAFLTKMDGSKAEANPEVKPTTSEPKPKAEEHKPVVKAPTLPPPNPAPVGKLDSKVLQKRLTTRLSVTDIREVFKAFADQTGVKIEVDKDVPDYKIDAFLINTSLKYALDVVTDATKLKYTFTEHQTLRISVK